MSAVALATPRQDAVAVRAVTAADIPAVVDLLARVDRRAADLHDARERLADILFHNPWRGDMAPSLVAEDAAGHLRGFLGVIPRPMTWGSRVVRAATGVRLTIDPECRDFVGLRLLRRFLEGPQDLSLIDGGGCATRAVWERLGGSAPVAYNVSWTRPLRPAMLALRRLPRAFGALSMVARAVDRALVTSRLSPFAVKGPSAAGHAADDHELVACFGRVAPRTHLRGAWTAASLEWVLQHARERSGGALQRVIVPGRGDAEAGAYVMTVAPGKTAQVLAMVCRPIDADGVLRDIIVRAGAAGCTAVHGRADLRLVIDLTDRGCLLHATRTHTLVHSRHADLIQQLERGDAMFGRLDGEWWLPV